MSRVSRLESSVLFGFFSPFLYFSWQYAKASLKTTTPERNIGLYYTDKANEELDWNFRVNTEYRNNIAGQEGKNGFGFGLYVDKKF